MFVVFPARHLVDCGRTDGRNVVVGGMLWRTAGKSARCAGELVVPEPFIAVRRHLSVYDSQWQLSALNFVPVGAGSS